MPKPFDLLIRRLASLLPNELKAVEFPQLLLPTRHSLLLSQRRATMIVNRVRLFAFLYALLTPLWSVVDLIVFDYPLWSSLAVSRLLASMAFASLLVFYRPNGNLLDAYRAIAILFFIPTVFYVVSHTLITGHQLEPFSAAVATGYAFLPFVLMAGLAIFPLTLVENLILASTLLLAQGLAGFLNWPVLNWPSYAGGYWLLVLIAGVTALACMSQLAFMIALVRQAIRDPLTGILSRGSGTEILHLLWSNAEQNNGCLALAFFDIDHFKAVNDTYGHEAGDRVLQEFTNSLQARMRGSDTLLRWGGEEFLLVMPNTDMNQARRALQRLTESGLGVRPDGTRLTASIGLAERCADKVVAPTALLELADHRMYRAKTGGRDQICSTPDGQPEPESCAQKAYC
ncbi:MAG TPA: GGDEF domain-containing protein [Pseudomonas sp.]|uniref:GGDEF domain-containing protein n=1 Tax=Pseudomonas sp. TaxID=306 RepID=UPI002C8AC18E|nr:GGDEF domain-containing protein [Pseudomonas sp.]HTO17633.1 GGDEF domain-containing protein [Pseudomonas sp.]